MYILKAFADSHPMNRLSAGIGIVIHSDELRAKIFRQFIADFQRDPLVVIKPKFWENMLLNLREQWHREQFGIDKPKNMKWELPYKRELAFEFDVIRLIYEDQFRRLEEQRVVSVYHEGYKDHPLKSFAIRLLGLGFCDLDSKTYRDYLTPEEQRKREQTDWIPRIRVSPSLESSRLVAGRNHIYNSYGFVDALAEKGIRLEVVADYKDISRLIT